MAAGTQTGLTWLAFTLLTVGAWGLYGVALHAGQDGMQDKTNGRYMAFLLVGIAYFLTAVLAPAAVLAFKGASLKVWAYPIPGLSWSLIAGILGAVGAFGVLLAFGAYGSARGPAVVMSLVFAGAPIVNAVVAMALHPPEGGVRALRAPFVIGILLAAAGGFLVARYKPAPGKKQTSHPPAQIESDS